MHFSPSYNEERQHSNKKMTSKPIVPNVKVKVAAKRNHSRLIISLASVKKKCSKQHCEEEHECTQR